jgi:hypothetical protein
MPVTTFGNNTGDIGGCDATGIQEASNSTNFGTDAVFGPALFAAGDSENDLIRFTGVSACIPAGSTINSVKGRLFMDSTNGSDANFAVGWFRMLRTWNESQATWLIYSTGNNWQTAGGVGANDSASAVSANLTVGNGNSGIYYEWNSTANFVNDVKAAIDASVDPSWILKRTDGHTTATTRPWGTDDYTDTFRPQLVVDWTAPTTQTLKPNADMSTGNWAASAGATLFAVLDETVRDDSDYALLSGVVGSTFKVGLSSATDPLSSINHNVSYAISGTQGNMNVRLIQDANTTIAEWSHTTTTGALSQFNQTLSNAQADSITNYANLSLEFRAF